MKKFFSRIPWGTVLLVLGLILLEVGMMPLGPGPDRLIHDPAVNRILDPNYMPGDWYTQMAVNSGVYPFYARLVGLYRFFHISEELWRTLLYLGGLAVLYTSLVKIGRLFSKNWFVIPLVALLAAKIYRPDWLYGPFMHIDGGLAPRTIGMSFSFLALYFLLTKRFIWSAGILGLATLIHVSNSFIVFTLFYGVWMIDFVIRERKEFWRQFWSAFWPPLLVYLLMGGWFAGYVFLSGGDSPSDFSNDKFIWTWTYLRAPYMALPLIGLGAWYQFALHIIALVLGSGYLWFVGTPVIRQRLRLLLLISLGAVVYFGLFYFFAFVRPWLPGFQFYSLRTIYFAYAGTYVIAALCLAHIVRGVYYRLIQSVKHKKLLIDWVVALVVLLSLPKLLVMAYGSYFPLRTYQAWDNSRIWISLAVSPPPDRMGDDPSAPVLNYLSHHPDPFLGPPLLIGTIQYTSHIAHFPSRYYRPLVDNFKAFGFTKEGLPEWYARMNDVSRGELEREYQAQVAAGQYKAVSLDWTPLYRQLTEPEILAMAKKYNFRLVLSYLDANYSFPVVAEDKSFRLYQIPL